jgi:hypothetical protein
MAGLWGSHLSDLGAVGHLNMVSGYGYRPQAEGLRFRPQPDPNKELRLHPMTPCPSL